MIKKIFLVSAIISLLAFSSCSKDSETTDNPTTADNSIEAQIAALNQLPYSSLTTSQQKLKLETDANEMLTQMDKLKTSGAIEAIQNLERLMEINNIDYLGGKSSNKVTDLLGISDAYGVYTWNNATQKWIKTKSTTELKFVFPAKKTQTVNNTVLTSNAVSSTVKYKVLDTPETGAWFYDIKTGTSTYVILNSEVYDDFYLPTNVDAKLTIDNVNAASIVMNNKFSGNKQAPDESTFKIVTTDGYTLDLNTKKGTTNTGNLVLAYNGKNLIEFDNNSNSNIDEILNENNRPEYIGKANTVVKLLDNFLIVGQNDFENYTKDLDVLKSSLKDPSWGLKSYFTDLNIYKKNISEGKATAFNKNLKMALVSKKDGTKIADIIVKSQKGYTNTTNVYWLTDNTNPNGGYWQTDFTGVKTQTIQYYDEINYLKFKDNTEVTVDTYFSTGFEGLEDRFQSFINAFNR